MEESQIQFRSVDEIPRCCGVYMLRHRTSGDTYIGSAINIRSRVKSHVACLIAGKHTPAMLKVATEHGVAFDAAVLEETPPEDRIRCESRLIAELRPTLNAATVNGDVKPRSVRDRVPVALRLNPELMDSLLEIGAAHSNFGPPTMTALVHAAIREYVEKHAAPDSSKRPRKQ